MSVKTQQAQILPNFKHQPQQYDLINQVNHANSELIKNPRSVADLLLRGYAYFLLEQYEQAEADFQSVLKLEPENRHALQQLVFLYEQTGDIESMMEYCRRVSELDEVERSVLIKLAINDDMFQQKACEQLVESDEVCELQYVKYAPYRSVSHLIKQNVFDSLQVPLDILIKQALGMQNACSNEQLLNDVMQLIKQNQFEDAISKLSDLIERGVSVQTCLIERAKCFVAIGRPQDAYVDFRQVLAGDNRNVFLMQQMAQILVQQQKFSEAQILIDQALQIQESADLLKQKAEILVFRENYSDAILQLQKSLKIKFSVDVLKLKADLLVKTENFHDALQDYELLIQTRRTPNDLISRALLLNQLNQFEKANLDLHAAFQLDPQPFILKILIKNCLVMNDPQNALKYSEKLLDIDGLSEENALLRADSLKAAQQFQKALELYQKLNEHSSSAHCYRKLNCFKEALQCYEKIERLTQKDLINKAFCNARLKKYIDAIKDYSDAITNEPHASLYYNRGICYQSLGMKPEATKDLMKCIELEPGNIQAKQALAK